MDFDLTADIRRPDLVRGFRFALSRHEKQDIATKFLWQVSLHQPNAVVIAIHDSFVVALVEHGEEMFVVTQGVDHIAYRVSRSGEQDFFMAFLLLASQGYFRVIRIAVEEREHFNFFAYGLEVSANCMRHQPSKGPAEQVVGSMRLNLSNKP